jgi:protein TonB
MLSRGGQHDFRRRAKAWSISIVLHGVVIACAVWQPTPIFVRPKSVRWGEGGTSLTPIYLARRGSEDLLPSGQASSEQSSRIRYSQPRKQIKPVDRRPDQKDQQARDKGSKFEEAPRAGSSFGSSAEGPSFGEEVKPALPIYGPQPQVAAYEIPSGLEGDVVVEITIDTAGNVTNASLLRGLGHGLDEKVLAVLQSWRFHPATRDGVPIASRQDVYFHFPRPV